MGNENKNTIDRVIDAGKNILKSAGRDYWNKSFAKYVSKYPKLKDIPGLEYLIKTNPKLAEYNTKDFQILFEGLAGAESSYRKLVNKNADTQYKGWYALSYKDSEKNLLDDDNYQHTKAFKHFVTNSMLRFTKEDFARAKQLGYSEDEFIAMTWNNGSQALNYLYNGANPKDGNQTTLDKYVDMYRSHRTNTNNLNFTQVVPCASQDLKIPIKSGDIYDKKQRLIRHYGREYNHGGGDLFRGNPEDSVRVMVNRGLQAGETLDFTDFKRTPPKSTIPYTKGGYPQNDTEFQLMMDDLQTIINNSNVKKFGGKLRYGWGGIKNYWDYANPYLGTADSGSYSNRDGRLAYEKHVNAASLFGSDYVSRSANEVISDKGWDPEKSYVYIQGQGYIPYIELTDAQKNQRGVNQGIYTITDDSMISALQAKDQSIYAEMQNKIDQDVARNQKLITNIARFGGMIGVRRKYPYGGTYTHQSPYSGYLGWGTEVKPENVSYTDYNAQGEGIIGKEIATYATSGLGVGASIGGLLGSVIPGIGNILGALIGAGVGAASGAGIGAAIGSQNKEEEEVNRRALIAEQRETNRQNTISNMNYRYENDVAKIRTATQPTTFSGQSFYMKHGGLMKPRMKYNNGGTILPNSSDTAVAYGRTHEQIDPMTGETGITYGNAEVEGGGLIGNKELPGEVIQQTPNGDRIYSDSLYVPGTRATYAQIAKALTDKKGTIEQEISTLQETLDTSLDAFNKAKLAKAKTGTATRNIEKLAAKLNLKTGELAQVDAQLNDVFTSQEQMATLLGLRDTTLVTARFGGYRPKYKFGIPEAGLITNGLSFIGNMLATGLSAKSTKESLDFMRNIAVPKTRKVEAEYHDIDTTPYEEASRQMVAETRRFNKWIEDNVSNPQVLRNQKRKNLITYYEGLNDINAKKAAYLSSRYDLNRNARIVARNTNNQGKYQDALNEYNKNMQWANTSISVKNQETQNYMAAMNQLMQAFGIYGNQKMYIASLAPGVQKEFYWGKKE